MFPEMLGQLAANGVQIIGELNVQNNALKRDFWWLLFELFCSNVVFAEAKMIPPSEENGNTEQIVVRSKRTGEMIHCLTLTETGVRCKIRGEDEEAFFEFGKISKLVDKLRSS